VETNEPCKSAYGEELGLLKENNYSTVMQIDTPHGELCYETKG